MDRRTLRLILWAPLVLFVAFVAIAWSGLLRPHDAAVASRMVGAPLPPLNLPPAVPDRAPPPRAGGGAHLVNLFASWCVPCAAEAPELAAIARAGVPIDGIAVRDAADDTADYLQRNGDPYRSIGADLESRAALALGSSGVPETFVVDAHGIIRAQHIGPIMPDEVPGLIAAVKAAT